ncbi:MAG: hypothetical protein JSV89_14875 [Spirochaetaceae bacterium]|nr:MAG: hypothetical protein JSV89_14875 [Spirochaetaceae bacterium]
MLSKFQQLLDASPKSEIFEIEKILNVYYLHIKCDNDDDLYITQYGLPFFENLKPHNFLTDKSWYDGHSIRLSGSGCTYKIKTKEIKSRSKDLVIKWNRMGQDIPGDDGTDEFAGAEFNSPFEEFSLVMELRNARFESPGTIITQRPLAIYVPSERVELWRTGRKEYKMKTIIDAHKDIQLDMFRSYVMIFEWIKGIDASHACGEKLLGERQVMDLTLRVAEEMKYKGFLVRDRKPHHIIVKPRNDGTLARDRRGEVLYAVIDYELLARTRAREQSIKRIRRINYHQRQQSRFSATYSDDFPPQLKIVNILGVDYVFGHVESTDGLLWVVGRDPDLFDYFLPERWETTPRTKLSEYHEIYHTVTKDYINMVWKVSKVGIRPDMDPFKEDERKILEHGYNSPFEEVSIAVQLSRKGIRTVYPRAIYVFGKEIFISDSIRDDNRHKSHARYLTPGGSRILKENHSYIIIWGYWNGPDERLAIKDDDYLQGINALNAYRQGLISEEEYFAMLKTKKERLAKSGIEDLNLRGTHLLLSVDHNGRLIRDEEGIPDMRICNFEFLRKIR